MTLAGDFVRGEFATVTTAPSSAAVVAFAASIGLATVGLVAKYAREASRLMPN